MTFSIGKQVLLNAKNIKLAQPTKKLSQRYLGPFEVLERIGKQAYKLQLPPAFRIHPIFHVSLLKPYKGNSNRDEQVPQTELASTSDEYEVDAILDYKIRYNKPNYLVKWKGWSNDYNQWLRESDLGGAHELLREFKKGKGRKPQKG